MLNKVEVFSDDLMRAVRRELPQLTHQEQYWLDFTVEEVTCTAGMYILDGGDDPEDALDGLAQTYAYEAAAKQKITFAVLGKAYLRGKDLKDWAKAYAGADTEQQRRLAQLLLRRCLLKPL